MAKLIWNTELFHAIKNEKIKKIASASKSLTETEKRAVTNAFKENNSVGTLDYWS